MNISEIYIVLSEDINIIFSLRILAENAHKYYSGKFFLSDDNLTLNGLFFLISARHFWGGHGPAHYPNFWRSIRINLRFTEEEAKVRNSCAIAAFDVI